MSFPVDDGPAPPRGKPLYRAEIQGRVEEKNRVIAEVTAALLAASGGAASGGAASAASGGGGRGPQSAPPAEHFRLRLCLDEAIQNAISHGNGGDPRKLVEVSLREVEEGWEVLVRDQGSGFSPGLVADPRESSGLHGEGGRGLLILQEYMDEVRFYERGRTLVMVRRRRTGTPSPR